MSETAPRLRLVIPAYREAARLPAFLAALEEAFAGAGESVDVLVVDDASPTEDWEALRTELDMFRARMGEAGAVRLASPLRLAVNTRKGGAILAGWRALAAAEETNELDWLGFVDADGAVPASEVARVWALTRARLRNDDAVFASRVGGPPDWVLRPWIRRWSGRAFAMLVRCSQGLELRDTQCGFKLVRRTAFAGIQDRLRDGHGFCFDVALAVALRRGGRSIREEPVRWREIPGGGFRPLRHLPKMVGELSRIRRIQ